METMSTIKAIKATRATIQLGDINLECLQFPDGSYHFFINQLNEVLAIKAGDSTGKKYLQPLIDKDPNRVNIARVDDIKSNLKTVSIDLVAEAIQIYAQLGNSKCLAVTIACMSEALERRADAAFNVKRTETERNERLKARVEGKVIRRTFTDVVKEYIDAKGIPKAQQGFIYANCSDMVNLAVLGMPARQARITLDLKPSLLLRDKLPEKALREIAAIEDLAVRLADNENLEPLEAIKKSIQVRYTKTIGIK